MEEAIRDMVEETIDDIYCLYNEVSAAPYYRSLTRDWRTDFFNDAKETLKGEYPFLSADQLNTIVDGLRNHKYAFQIISEI